MTGDRRPTPETEAGGRLRRPTPETDSGDRSRRSTQVTGTALDPDADPDPAERAPPSRPPGARGNTGGFRVVRMMAPGVFMEYR